MKKKLQSLGFEITSEEIKPYGTYYKGFIEYNKAGFKLEINVSIVKGSKNIYINLSENHYRGNVKGYIKSPEELEPIVVFMTRERND